MDWFNVFKDEHGKLLLVVPPRVQDDVAEQLRMSNRLGISQYVAITILQDRIASLESLLQDRIAAMEALLAPLAPLPPGSRPATPTMQRRGRVDKVPFGWKVSAADDMKLIPDREEEETIAVVRVLAARKLSLREICRRLDSSGCARRGKKWGDGGGHHLILAVLRRAGCARVE